MNDFTNVTIVKKANVYSDGKVTSRSVLFADGSKKTLDIMLPGDYTFGTDTIEIMEILEGDLDVLLPGETAWKTFHDGDTFKVPAHAKFSLKIKSLTDYCCSYV